MARIREEDYAYAVARIRAIETRLINQGMMDRLLNMTNPSDAAKLLIEAGYDAHADNSKNALENIEQIFAAELKKAYDLLLDILPDPQPVYLFMKRYDYLNAKLIIKGELLGINVSKGLSPMGTIMPERLAGYIIDRKLDELSDIFRNGILDSIDTFNRTRDPQTIDFILDKACFMDMLEDAKSTGEPYLVELVKTLIDAANIRIFARAKLLSLHEDFIRRALISNGHIPREKLDELSGRDIEDFFEALKQAGLEKLSAEISKAITHPDGISEVEKVIDDSLISFLRKSKYVTLGVEPVIAYLFYKETEIKNARIVITGLMNNIPPGTIKERLRLGYA